MPGRIIALSGPVNRRVTLGTRPNRTASRMWMLTKCQSCNSGVPPGQLFHTHASAGDFRAQIAAGCCVEAVGYMLIDPTSMGERERLLGVYKSAVRSKRLRCRKSRSGGRNQNQNTANLVVPSSFRIPLFRYSGVGYAGADVGGTALHGDLKDDLKTIVFPSCDRRNGDKLGAGEQSSRSKLVWCRIAWWTRRSRL